MDTKTKEHLPFGTSNARCPMSQPSSKSLRSLAYPRDATVQTGRGPVGILEEVDTRHNASKHAHIPDYTTHVSPPPAFYVGIYGEAL